MDDTGAILKGIYHEFEVAEHNNGMHAVIIVQHALARTFKYNLPPLPKKTLVIKKESAKSKYLLSHVYLNSSVVYNAGRCPW